MIRPVAADGRIETGGAFTPILRPRVVDRIASAAMQRIVLIIAPAGYGKSVALRQYLSQIGEQHVRYDVREEHANLLGFVRGFADAFTNEAPDARNTVSGAYEKSRSSKTPGVDLAMWLHAHIKTFTGVVAIDDLHLAENDPEISKFLVSLIERTKGRARWIIASRSTLDLPVGSWLAYGDMDLNIDEQDLRFNIEEAWQTAKASRVGVREEELEKILSMTEGWPTALSFAIRSSTRSVDLRNIAASTREMVYRYLAEQVYKSLDADEHALLHFIGYLKEINLDVLKRAGFVRAKAVIEALRDRVAFIYPDRPNVYRCHDLFRDFLQHQLDLQGDDVVAEIQRRVAAALEENGDIASALELYVKMRAEDDILRLLTQHGLNLMQQAHGDVVHLALEVLSQESRATNAIALALRGLRQADSGRYDRAESLLGRAISEARNDALAADLTVRLGSILFNLGRDVISLLEPVGSNESLTAEMRAQAISFLVPAYAFAGRADDASKAMHQAEKFAETVESDELRAKIYHRMGIAGLHLQLPLERVAGLFNRAHTLASERKLYLTAASAFGGSLTVSLLYEDDATKTVWYAQQAINSALKAGDRLTLQTSLLQLIDVEARRGNIERVAAIEQQFASVSTTDSARTAYMLPTRAMMCAWGGRFAEASRLLKVMPTGLLHGFDRALHGALHALYALGDGKRDEALALASQTYEEITAATFDYLYGVRVGEVARLLCCVTEAFAGRLTNANRILSRKSEVDGPAPDAMRQVAIAVCRMMKNPSLAGDVAEALEALRAIGWGGIGMIVQRVSAQIAAGRAAEESPLTRAELDVLEALAQGQSPKSIAQESGRSVYTIQAHIQNVIKKLGCSGRGEALTVARKKGLLKFN
jgi:ATP/maltotriose-dependent transcriptional regulator MalT